MSEKRQEEHPAELMSIVERLRADRPDASDAELDELKSRIARRSAQVGPSPFPGTKGVAMRSRIVLVSALVVGIMLTGTGATLAISGLSSSDSAGTAQYVGPGGDGEDGDGAGGTLGDPGDGAGGLDGRGAEQIAAQGDEGLPFTGFAAIPLVIGGVVMLVAGVALHRRTS